jgi:hypothetical protein
MPAASTRFGLHRRVDSAPGQILRAQRAADGGADRLINEVAMRKFRKTVGFVNPLIYTTDAHNVFRNITVGKNDMFGKLHGLYTACPGWNACTGLGVPNGASLLQWLGLEVGRDSTFRILGCEGADRSRQKGGTVAHEVGSGFRHSLIQ